MRGDRTPTHLCASPRSTARLAGLCVFQIINAKTGPHALCAVSTLRNFPAVPLIRHSVSEPTLAPSTWLRNHGCLCYSVTQLDLKLTGPPQKTVLFEHLHIPTLLHELCDYRAATTSSFPPTAWVKLQAPAARRGYLSAPRIVPCFANSGGNFLHVLGLWCYSPRYPPLSTCLVSTSLPFSLLCICKERQALPSNEQGPWQPHQCRWQNKDEGMMIWGELGVQVQPPRGFIKPPDTP